MLSEIDNYLERLDDLRRLIKELIAGLPPNALDWRPIEGVEGHDTNSLAVLATHVAGAEHFWIAEVVGGRPPTRDRDAEFRAHATSAADLVALLDRVGDETRRVLAGLSEAELAEVREVRDRRVAVRWAILHIVEHAALHLGHMQLTYQAWAGGQSRPSPFWFERINRE